MPAPDIYRVAAGSHFHVLDARWREPLEAIAHPKIRQHMAGEIERVEGYSPVAAVAVAQTLEGVTGQLLRRLDYGGPLWERTPFAGAMLGRADIADAISAHAIAIRILGEAWLRYADVLDERAIQRRAA